MRATWLGLALKKSSKRNWISTTVKLNKEVPKLHVRKHNQTGSVQQWKTGRAGWTGHFTCRKSSQRAGCWWHPRARRVKSQLLCCCFRIHSAPTWPVAPRMGAGSADLEWVPVLGTLSFGGWNIRHFLIFKRLSNHSQHIQSLWRRSHLLLAGHKQGTGYLVSVLVMSEWVQIHLLAQSHLLMASPSIFFFFERAHGQTNNPVEIFWVET